MDNELKEVIDSVENDLYQSSTIVAKFPDRQRHGMFYLQNGHLHLFDASNQTHEEIDITALNPKATVDYNGSGVLNAYLSTNEKYILIIASRNAGNTEFGSIVWALMTRSWNSSTEGVSSRRKTAIP